MYMGLLESARKGRPRTTAQSAGNRHIFGGFEYRDLSRRPQQIAVATSHFT
jgi:hypothetical protein